MMNCKESLLFKVFSPKFFPSGNILDASEKTRGSFAWRSIMQAKKLILAGTSWRVGNGQKIPIKDSKWLPEEGHRKVISPVPDFPHDAKVADLIKGSPPEWDTEKIRGSFLPYDADAILQIPLSYRSPPDKLIWHAIKNGKFSVRSGYHLLLQEEQNSNPGSSQDREIDPLWKVIWSMRVPAKIRSFIWRACHESLPTKMGLMRRKVMDSPWCASCGTGTEDCLHALWSCPLLNTTWSSQHKFSDLQKVTHSSFTELVRQVGMLNQDLILEEFAMICWLLWHKRNKNRLHLPSEGEINAKERSVKLPKPSTSWRPPISHQYKVNFDGAIFQEAKMGGIGVVVRDQAGMVIATLSQRVITSPSAELIEARAARRAIQFAMEIGILDVQFEGDSETIIRELSNQEVMHNASGLIIEDAKALLHHFQRYMFTHTRRSGNSVAHALARRALDIPNFSVWMEDAPPDIIPILYSDFLAI
uniref:Uncharacterized protein n=1 Tax=Fagus sylvatica TaxID=28930 RepID=A0A2N9FT78_FAGSY